MSMTNPSANRKKRGSKGLVVMDVGSIGHGNPEDFPVAVLIGAGQFERASFRGVERAFKDCAIALRKALDDPLLERILVFLERRLREASERKAEMAVRLKVLEGKRRDVGDLWPSEEDQRRRLERHIREEVCFTTTEVRKTLERKFGPIRDKELHLRLDFLARIGLISPLVVDEQGSGSMRSLGLDRKTAKVHAAAMGAKVIRNKWIIQVPFSRSLAAFEVGGVRISLQLKVESSQPSSVEDRR